MSVTQPNLVRFDLVGQFVADCTTHALGARVQAAELYRVYCAWAEAANMEPWTATAFGRALNALGLGRHVSNIVYYENIRLLKFAADFIDGVGKPIPHEIKTAPRQPPMSALPTVPSVDVDPAGFVYVMTVDEHPSVIKIGWAVNPRRRLDQIQTAHWQTVRIVISFYGHRSAEADLQKRFAQHHIRGEWFHRAPEIEEFIASSAAKSFPTTTFE